MNRWLTCHGLRPRHADDMLTANACDSAGFQEMKPLASCDKEYFGAQYLHLRCGRQTAVPLASYDSLPPHTQSSVPVWWLAFDRAGLSSWFTSALLGALMYSPCQRFRKHGDAYFRFITTPGIEPTNNLAEQAIRFVVIDRYITQGTRSENGRLWSERICTVLATCASQGRTAFDFICQFVQAHFTSQPYPSFLGPSLPFSAIHAL